MEIKCDKFKQQLAIIKCAIQFDFRKESVEKTSYCVIQSILFGEKFTKIKWWNHPNEIRIASTSEIKSKRKFIWIKNCYESSTFNFEIWALTQFSVQYDSLRAPPSEALGALSSKSNSFMLTIRSVKSKFHSVIGAPWHWRPFRFRHWIFVEIGNWLSKIHFLFDWLHILRTAALKNG